MHELGLAAEIVDVAVSSARGARVARVVVEVGVLTAVLPDALAFCFEVVSAGTPAEGATLELITIPGAGRCRACDAEVVLDGPLGACACGGVDLEWTRGHELRVRELEVGPCA